MTLRPMTAESKRSLAVFFGALIVICGVFDFMDIRYSAGTRNIMWGVTLATLFTFWFTKRDLKTLGWGWGKWRYQWLAFLIPMGYCLVTYAIIWAAGFGGFYNTDFVTKLRDNLGFKGWSDWAVLLYFLPVTALFGMPGSLATALGEEIGWRGFLVPELAKSMSFTKVALLTGIIWAAWHLPIILLGNYHNNSPAALPVYGQLVMFFTGVMSLAIMMAYLRLKSGSLWTGALTHASHNLAVQAIFNPITVMYADSPKYVDELGLVLPLTMLPVGVYFFFKGRREFG